MIKENSAWQLSKQSVLFCDVISSFDRSILIQSKTKKMAFYFSLIPMQFSAVISIYNATPPFPFLAIKFSHISSTG